MFCLHCVRSQGLGHICTLSLPSTTNIIYISLGFPVLQDVLPQSPKPVTVCVTYVEHRLFISWPHPTPWSPAIALCPAETITANYCGNAIKVQNFLYFFLFIGWGRRPSPPTTNRISHKTRNFSVIHYETVKLKNHTMQILPQQE